MKTVYFIRHAKSSWEDMSLRDSERPLNKRGFRDAPFMSKLFKAKETLPDIIFSSPAVRAYTTARFFAEELGWEEKEIQTDPDLYLGNEDYIIQKINMLDDSVNTVCFFGHNPTTTNLANIFHDDYVANVPTCAIVKVQGEIDSWQHFNPKAIKFVEIHYPKQYFT